MLPEGGSGVCITGAIVQVIVDGAVVQTKTQQPCDYWDPDYDLVFKDLPVRRSNGSRICARVAGAREITAIPSNGSISAVAIVLPPANQ